MSDPPSEPLDPAVVLFAGGGTGGHIYPNVAVAERLLHHPDRWKPHFLVSGRPGDAAILERLGYEYSTSPVEPMPPLSRPWRSIRFLTAWYRSVRGAGQLLERLGATAVVATGGFVSGPAVVAAVRRGIPCALVNLDAIPGKANRRLARYRPALFTVYPADSLPGATPIGLPLRRASVGDADSPEQARQSLGLDPALPVLFVTGATHGAESIIRAMMTLVGDRTGLLEGWQVFHQCGTFDVETLARTYREAGVAARVVSYCDRMGTAWQAASLAVSRAGAGSVAEAWANATPTLFLPNPYHRDQHQRHNAEPMVATGGAAILVDRVDPDANAKCLYDTLCGLMKPAALQSMRQALEGSRPADGAAALAAWLRQQAT